MRAFRQVRRSFWRTGAAVGCAMFAMAGGATGASAATGPRAARAQVSISRVTVPRSGGAVVIRSRRLGATSCGFTVVPRIDKFDTRIRCHGSTFRVLHLPANLRERAITYAVRATTFSRAGNTAKIVRVTEAGLPATITAPAPAPKVTTSTLKTPPPAPVVAPAPTAPVTAGGGGFFSGGGGAPASGGSTSGGSTGGDSAGSGSTSVGSPRANVDPSYTQSASNPLEVTWSYSASVSSGSLPTGTLTLTVTEPNAVGSAGGCTMNVGGTVTGGNCTVTLPSFGNWEVTVTYAGGTSGSTYSDTEDIQPPAPATITNVDTWGTTAPSNPPSASITVDGLKAAVIVTDASWVGLTSTATALDNFGDKCNLTISGTQATCNLTLAHQITSASQLNGLTIDFPGAPTQTTTQTVSPWGVPQQQTLITEWPPIAVGINNPNVTLEQANVRWDGGQVRAGSTVTSAWSAAPPSNPLVLTAPNNGVLLEVYTTGNINGDLSPTGTIAMTLTQTAGTGTYTEYNMDSGSSDCSAMQAFNGAASGSCLLSFSGSGTWTVSVSYNSNDPNYLSLSDVLTQTITVG